MAAKNARGQARAVRRALLGDDAVQTAGTERGAVMSTVEFAAPALPLHTAGPYVAAAYIVFVLIVLVYLGIMAVRLQRTERELVALRRDLADAGDAAAADESSEDREQEPVA